jgi:hypothetical protein
MTQEQIAAQRILLGITVNHCRVYPHPLPGRHLPEPILHPEAGPNYAEAHQQPGRIVPLQEQAFPGDDRYPAKAK